MRSIPAAAPSIPEYHLMPLDTISGFEVRPGLYEMNGATALSLISLYIHAMRFPVNCCFSATRKQSPLQSFHFRNAIESATYIL